LPAAARERRARVRSLWLTIFAVIAIAAIFLAREAIMKRWPATVPVFAALHLAEMPGIDLQVSVSPTRTADSLVVNGDIVNTAASARRVPRLRVALQDAGKHDVSSRVLEPPVETLPAGGTASFKTVFERPDAKATDVAVTFVPQ
jgi:hypothetical protein